MTEQNSTPIQHTRTMPTIRAAIHGKVAFFFIASTHSRVCSIARHSNYLCYM